MSIFHRAGVPSTARPLGNAMGALRLDIEAAWRAIIGNEGSTARDGSFLTSPAGPIGPAQVMPAPAARQPSFRQAPNEPGGSSRPGAGAAAVPGRRADCQWTCRAAGPRRHGAPIEVTLGTQLIYRKGDAAPVRITRATNCTLDSNGAY